MCSVGQIACVVKAGRGPRPKRVKTETTQVQFQVLQKQNPMGVLLNRILGDT